MWFQKIRKKISMTMTRLCHQLYARSVINVTVITIIIIIIIIIKKEKNGFSV